MRRTRRRQPSRASAGLARIAPCSDRFPRLYSTQWSRLMDRGDHADQTFLTTAGIARRLRASQEKVLGWIRRGELKAIDLGNRTRPQYRVSPEDFQAFLKRRGGPAAAR